MSPEMEGMPLPQRHEGYDLLPKHFPDAELLGPYVQTLRAWSDETKEDSEDELRAIHWTVALENAFERSRFAASMPGFQMATYGFANPEIEQPAFGVIVYTAPSEVYKIASFYNRDEQNQSDPASPYGITVGDVRFPIFVRQREIEFHSLSVNPRSGTAACWAKSKRPPLASKTAVLTAKHIFGQPVLGTTIPLTSGSGKLIDVAPEGVDAALVEVTQTPATPSRKLRSRTLVAQWIDVDLHTQHSIIRTKVVEVNSSRGTLHHSIPLRIFLAHSANPGDSGSLVTTPSGMGIGLYMGSVTNPGTQLSEGFCQHLAQAASALQVDLLL
jgi:hypothetical protein